jgi:lipopolysaccharide export system permease protein
MMLVLVATGFIFGPLRDGTVGLRVFIGPLVGLAFKISQDLVTSITLVYGITPWLAVLLPLAVGAAAGVYLLKRGS